MYNLFENFDEEGGKRLIYVVIDFFEIYVEEFCTFSCNNLK